MNWTEHINRGRGIVPVGSTKAQIFHWNYVSHLDDNAPHRHTYFEVCRVGRYGGGHFIVEGREHPIGPGDVFIARPGVVHQIVNTAQPLMELFWVSYSWPHVENAKGGLPGGDDETLALLRSFAASPEVVVRDDDGRIGLLWETLRALAEAPPRPGHDLQLMMLTSSLLLAIAQSTCSPAMPMAIPASTGDAASWTTRLAVRYVHDNLDRPLSIPEIAAQVHVSPRHLSRLWRRFTGVTPAVYIERARLDRAAALLDQGDTPIKEIALGVGYADVHHFTRVFGRCFACPPGEYRRRMQAGEPLPIIPPHGDVRNIHIPGALV